MLQRQSFLHEDVDEKEDELEVRKSLVSTIISYFSRARISGFNIIDGAVIYLSTTRFCIIDQEPHLGF